MAISLGKMLNRLRGLPLSRDPQELSPYRAVSVVPTPSSCPAAVAIRNTRFLMAEAPTLPLPMCTWPTSCPCRLAIHEDRRICGRRAEELLDTPLERKERRRGRGRRTTD